MRRSLPLLRTIQQPAPPPVQAGPRRGRAFAFAAILVCILLGLPGCKKKDAAPSNEQSAALPSPAVTPPASNPSAAAPDNSSPAQAPAAAEPAPAQPLIVAAGTPIAVRLTDELGSKISQSGQTFSATVEKDVIVDGQTAILANSGVTGTVVLARPVGHLAGEPALVLRLTSANINNVDQPIVTAARSFGSPIKAQGKVKKFFGGLAKRAEGDEREVHLAAQSAYTFILKRPLQVQ